ncbi:hypothetical protein B0T18DRAFT_313840, partial [Schizothecium vesticola]
AGAKFSIPPATLYNRAHGVTIKKQSKICKQRLTLAYERFLVDWTLYKKAISRALSRR